MEGSFSSADMVGKCFMYFLVVFGLLSEYCAV